MRTTKSLPGVFDVFDARVGGPVKRMCSAVLHFLDVSLLDEHLTGTASGLIGFPDIKGDIIRRKGETGIRKSAQCSDFGLCEPHCVGESFEWSIVNRLFENEYTPLVVYPYTGLPVRLRPQLHMSLATTHTGVLVKIRNRCNEAPIPCGR